MINLPNFKIGNSDINLIQGGMGVGISGKNLASAVANAGGAGIIASVCLGSLKGYSGNPVTANSNALRDEIRATRKMTNGVVGVNILRALTNYENLAQVSAEENVDLIISGAGLALDLPKIVGDKPIALVPIVSNARVAKIITKVWSKSNKVPDAFIVEGPMAGGHLGFKYDDLINNTAPTLENIAKGVIDFANSFDTPIPVIVAGGVYTGQDIAYYQSIGAAGVQMGTRFVTTLECDASIKFKETYIYANKDDLVIIKSPVGMPGRAIKNDFLEQVIAGEKIDFKCAYHCLETCKPKESPYCIAEALIGAQKGDFRRGFAFAGENAYRATPENCLDVNGKFITVETLMQRISNEYQRI